MSLLHHTASVSWVVLRGNVRNGSVASSFMVITLSQSLWPGDQWVQWISWEPSVWIYESAELGKRIAHLPLFSAHQKMSVNNVRELIQGGSALTAVRRCFLPVATDPQKFTYPSTSRNFNIPNTTRSIFLIGNKPLSGKWSRPESLPYPFQIVARTLPCTHTHPIQHVAQHVAGHRRGPGRACKGPLRARGG